MPGYKHDNAITIDSFSTKLIAYVGSSIYLQTNNKSDWFCLDQITGIEEKKTKLSPATSC